MRRMKRTNSVVSQEENGVVLPPAGRVLGVDDTSSNELIRQLLSALLAYKAGNFSVRLPSDWTGVAGKLADAFNEIADSNQRLSTETARVSHAVGKEGKLKQRLSVPGARGDWASKVEAVNTLIDDLVWPTTEVTRTISAVAKGDLTQPMTLEVDGRPLEGEFLRSAKIVNKMIEQLGVFTSEATRVAREVGTEGKLGGQLRNIAEVTTAVARGDLSRKITVDVKGEILELKNTINTMVDQLNAFASEVTRVAREVGTEGKLGGQAQVPGVAGTWKDLT